MSHLLFGIDTFVVRCSLKAPARALPVLRVRKNAVGSSAATRLVAYWGGPLWRPWNPLRFWRLVLGPSMDKIFPRVVIRLAASHCS